MATGKMLDTPERDVDEDDADMDPGFPPRTVPQADTAPKAFYDVRRSTGAAKAF
jgi:hypothetical protein